MIPLRFENVSKKYRRHHEQGADDDFYAVRDVSFECHEGEVLGLVGRNGGGKSTILKLAANVIAPSSGRVERVMPIAPMLELGAGFHPDLTGRDNIRLNGALLGMGRKIPQAKFDEIVAFAELAPHIDTPVKHYSSGMSARLGFAIAVHSTAKLLLVDEVLSVGDKLFQQKCLQKMIDLRRQGTAIVLVSHDDSWIRGFCTRALLIDKGSLIADTTPDHALQEYDLRLYNSNATDHHGVVIERVEIFTANDAPLEETDLEQGVVRVKIHYDASGVTAPWEMVAKIRRQDGAYPVMSVAGQGPAKGVATLELERVNLVIGRYLLEIAIEDAETLTVLASQTSNFFYVPGPFDERRGYHGIVRVDESWSFE